MIDILRHILAITIAFTPLIVAFIGAIYLCKEK
jgi:hypothetical protein